MMRAAAAFGAGTSCVGCVGMAARVPRVWRRRMGTEPASDEPKSGTVCDLSDLTLERVTKNYRRFYRVEGDNNLYPSVTSVLSVLSKPGLQQWALRGMANTLEKELLELQRTGEIGGIDEAGIKAVVERASATSKKQLEAAGDFGTRAHDVIDAIIRGSRGEGLQIENDILPVVKNFWDWWVDSGVTLDPRGDTMIYSPTYGYAGALDALARTPEGDLMVCDWKTSNAIYESHLIQVCAYAKAVEEVLLRQGVAQEDARVRRACVVRFEKSAKGYEVREVENIEDNFRAFKSALYLYHFRGMA